MDKSIYFGIGGILIGALLSSFYFLTFGTTVSQPITTPVPQIAHEMHGSEMTMNDMVHNLEGKTGDDFDREFIRGMIDHHVGAIEMAKLVERQAKHDELKDMAKDIINTQTSEVDKMRDWQQSWGY